MASRTQSLDANQIVYSVGQPNSAKLLAGKRPTCLEVASGTTLAVTVIALVVILTAAPLPHIHMLISLQGFVGYLAPSSLVLISGAVFSVSLFLRLHRKPQATINSSALNGSRSRSSSSLSDKSISPSKPPSRKTTPHTSRGSSAILTDSQPTALENFNTELNNAISFLDTLEESPPPSEPSSPTVLPNSFSVLSESQILKIEDQSLEEIDLEINRALFDFKHLEVIPDSAIEESKIHKEVSPKHSPQASLRTSLDQPYKIDPNPALLQTSIDPLYHKAEANILEDNGKEAAKTSDTQTIIQELNVDAVSSLLENTAPLESQEQSSATIITQSPTDEMILQENVIISDTQIPPTPTSNTLKIDVQPPSPSIASELSPTIMFTFGDDGANLLQKKAEGIRKIEIIEVVRPLEHASPLEFQEQPVTTTISVAFSSAQDEITFVPASESDFLDPIDGQLDHEVISDIFSTTESAQENEIIFVPDRDENDLLDPVEGLLDREVIPLSPQNISSLSQAMDVQQPQDVDASPLSLNAFLKKITPLYIELGNLLKSGLIANYQTTNPLGKADINKYKLNAWISVKKDIEKFDVIWKGLWSFFHNLLNNLQFIIGHAGDLDKLKTQIHPIFLKNFSTIHDLKPKFYKNTFFKDLVDQASNEKSSLEKTTQTLIDKLLEILHANPLADPELQRLALILISKIGGLSHKEIHAILKETLDDKKPSPLDALWKLSVINNDYECAQKLEAELDKFSNLSPSFATFIENELKPTIKRYILLNDELEKCSKLSRFSHDMSDVTAFMLQIEQKITAEPDKAHIYEAEINEYFEHQDELENILKEASPECLQNPQAYLKKLKTENFDLNKIFFQKIVSLKKHILAEKTLIQIQSLKNLSDAEYQAFFTKFIDACLLKGIVDAQENQIIEEIDNYHQKFLNQKNFFSYEHCLFEIHRYLPLVFSFLDISLKRVLSLKEVLLETNRQGNVLGYSQRLTGQAKEAQTNDPILEKLDEKIEELSKKLRNRNLEKGVKEQSKKQIEELEKNKELRVLSLVQIYNLEERFSLTMRKKIKLTEIDKDAFIAEEKEDIDPLTQQLLHLFPTEIKHIKLIYQKLGVNGTIRAQEVEDPNFDFAQTKRELEAELSAKFDKEIKLMIMPFNERKDFYTSKTVPENLKKECDKIHTYIQNYHREAYERLHAHINPGNEAKKEGEEKVLFGKPIGAELSSERWILIKRYENGKIAKAAYVAIGVANSTNSLGPLVSLAQKYIPNFKLDIPGFTTAENKEFIDHVAGLVYLFDYPLHDLVFNGQSPLRELIADLINPDKDGIIYKILTENIPELMQDENPSIDGIDAKLQKLTRRLCQGLDPDQILTYARMEPKRRLKAELANYLKALDPKFKVKKDTKLKDMLLRIKSLLDKNDSKNVPKLKAALLQLIKNLDFYHLADYNLNDEPAVLFDKLLQLLDDQQLFKKSKLAPKEQKVA